MMMDDPAARAYARDQATRGARPSSARAIACDTLAEVLERHRPLEETLAGHPGFSALAGRDRAFARLLLATTLRRLGQIDALIDHCLARPLPRAALRAQHILRLGAAQLLFLDTAPHAAVSSAVDLAEQAGVTAHKKLINAVLRRLSREGAELRDAQDAPRLNTPGWLWQSWSAAYGEEATRAIAIQHLSEPPLDLSLKPGLDAAQWAERLTATVLPNGSLRRAADTGGQIAELPGYGDGCWWVQDAAASLPARILAAALDGQGGVSGGDLGGRRIIDLCAAPGGKTAQLAAAGATVTAIEKAPPRLARLQGNLARLGLTAETIAADAAEWRPQALADGVLLDAPCSATGTIRRHPDIAWTKRASDPVKLAPLQDRLLANAFTMVKPGGVLVYAVCSLQPEEGPARVAAALKGIAGGEFEPVSLGPEATGGLLIEPLAAGAWRSLPCHLGAQGGLDGFYIAVLKRRG